ncbi:hypothetical protein [Duganella violaceipulchra]|uniref:Uncharacterized protein n=1 Tax=Duganella violaceipulchra TaxID=2849652 RepID=A0AA41L6L9_9BURK|nr:hypothetical protein [Duganella violaceicalia]MBV6323442.1 hypothetical protein [Duganella violaceicalia]MCP2007604.1 hypothetical protein [Duganella violaceicalia]
MAKAKKIKEAAHSNEREFTPQQLGSFRRESDREKNLQYVRAPTWDTHNRNLIIPDRGQAQDWRCS